MKKAKINDLTPCLQEELTAYVQPAKNDIEESLARHKVTFENVVHLLAITYHNKNISKTVEEFTDDVHALQAREGSKGT